jgi:hypothetical protein
MPDPKDDPKSCEWRPYIFARDQWHCRICGESFLHSETVRKHIANEHNETMPPSMYKYFSRRGLAAKEAFMILPSTTLGPAWAKERQAISGNVDKLLARGHVAVFARA